ncbi:MAG: tetratricopeptide repeat protein [Bdellovibrionales bacterium]
MFVSSHCPRCHSEIAQERLQSMPKVCDHCGHVLSDQEQKSKESLQKNFKFAMVAFSAIFILGYLSISTWGGYTFEMRWLQLGEMMGSNNMADKERMAQICLSTYRYDCTEEIYLSMAKSDSKQFMRLGKFQMSRQRYDAAAESFRSYLAANEDTNFDATYLYARSLDQVGRIDEASQLYESIIKAKTDVLQVTVIQKYIDLLKRHNRWAEARRILDEIRRRDESVRDFMDRDYTEISQHLGGSAS